MKVYIAGASDELEWKRIESWGQRLTKCGVDVVSTWLDKVKSHGASNPRVLTTHERRKLYANDLAELITADIMWLMVPPLARPSCGAWVECGFYLQAMQVNDLKTLIVSGDTRQSIFCALANAEFEDDADAFVEILSRLPPH